MTHGHVFPLPPIGEKEKNSKCQGVRCGGRSISSPAAWLDPQPGVERGAWAPQKQGFARCTPDLCHISYLQFYVLQCGAGIMMFLVAICRSMPVCVNVYVRYWSPKWRAQPLGGLRKGTLGIASSAKRHSVCVSRTRHLTASASWKKLIFLFLQVASRNLTRSMGPAGSFKRPDSWACWFCDVKWRELEHSPRNLSVPPQEASFS